jgi:hypothetical protein
MKATVSCPNCGYQQGATAKCRKCSTLFDYYYMGPPKANADDSQPPETAEPPTGFLRRIFRLLTGSARPS